MYPCNKSRRTSIKVIFTERSHMQINKPAHNLKPKISLKFMIFLDRIPAKQLIKHLFLSSHKLYGIGPNISRHVSVVKVT